MKSSQLAGLLALGSAAAVSAATVSSAKTVTTAITVVESPVTVVNKAGVISSILKALAAAKPTSPVDDTDALKTATINTISGATAKLTKTVTTKLTASKTTTKKTTTKKSTTKKSTTKKTTTKKTTTTSRKVNVKVLAAAAAKSKSKSLAAAKSKSKSIAAAKSKKASTTKAKRDARSGPKPQPTTPSKFGKRAVPAYGSCGVTNWSGIVTTTSDCNSGYYCQSQNQYYYQCVAGTATSSSSSTSSTTSSKSPSSASATTTTTVLSSATTTTSVLSSASTSTSSVPSSAVSTTSSRSTTSTTTTTALKALTVLPLSIASTLASLSLSISTSTALTLGVNDPCGPQPVSPFTYVPSILTPASFLSDVKFALLSSTAKTPQNYTWSFAGFYASLNQPGYLTMSSPGSYTPSICADFCNSIDSCKAFAIFFERSPVLSPAAACPDPLAQTNIFCTYYDRKLDVGSATNIGGWRGDFGVVISGSNGYSKV